jgi:hydroxypyruvate isomerase
MPRFAANLSMLYPELPFLERFGAAAADGFEAVEFLFPYEYDPDVIAAELRRHDLQQVLFNSPPGDWSRGERGLACLPGREDEFRSGIGDALRYAQVLNCPRIHAMAGVVPNGLNRERARDTYIANLRAAAADAALAGITLTIEPINPRDIPGFFLNRQDDAHALLAEIGAPNVAVQMDLYHCQIVEGDVATNIRRWLPTGRVGHFQIAGVPERHEPDVGELNYAYLFRVIDEVSAECGWQGWVGCEYRPARGAVARGTSDGLAWFHPLRHATGKARSSAG